MKKVCMITTISATLKSFVVETAKYLHEKCGYDVTLVCNNDPAFQQSLPEYIHFIPVPMSRGINFSGFKSIKIFKKLFKEQQFDMVQYATPNASFYASIAAKSVKVPFRVYCQWGIRYVGFSGIKRKIFKFLEKIVCKKSTHVFAVSPKNMQFAIDEKLYKPNKAQVIGNGGTIGVDMDEYDISKKQLWRDEIRSKYGIKSDEVTFGFVGRISVDKGVKELLSAFKDASSKVDNLKLLVVGPTDDDADEMKEILDWANSSKNVVFTGRVNNTEIKKYYSAMDVLVHPTYREGFGMVIQEAGALAVPVITTKIPGASEVMVNGESCVLVDPRNQSQLEDAMTSIKGDVDRLSKNAYERTKALYERKIMLENQRQAYEKLLGE